MNVIDPEPELHGLRLYGRISTFHFVTKANSNFVCVSSLSLSIALTPTSYLQLISLRDALCHLAPSLAQRSVLIENTLSEHRKTWFECHEYIAQLSHR